MSQNVLELRDVTRVHGSGTTAVHALRGISLRVEAGDSSRSWARRARASPRC